MILTSWLFFILASSLPFSLPVVGQGIEASLDAAGIASTFPQDADYASASKAFNLRFSSQPAGIAFPTNAQQVVAAVQAAASAGNRIVARSGGHSYTANGVGSTNGALVIDLKNLKTISVNTANGQATIGTGNRLGNIVTALNAKGRALPHGTCPYVGIGGHAAHGGFGYTSRMWGLTLDTIIGAEVVLANGTLLNASKTQNADLFWALRGSGSSFGVVTSLTFQTFAVPSYAIVYQYGWDVTATVAAKAIRSLQTFATSNVPKELGIAFVFGKGSAKGKVYMELSGGWYGAQSALTGALQPLLSQLPTPAWHENHGNGTYIDSASFLGGGLSTTNPDVTDNFYAKSLMTPTAAPLTEAATVAYMNHLANAGFTTNLDWFNIVELYGGSNSAINAVAFDDTAFGKRNTLLTFQFYATNPAGGAYPASAFTFVDRMAGNLTANMPSSWDYGSYANYVDDRLSDWQTRYYGSHYPRLKTLKRSFDPSNLFRFPTSIELA